MHSTAISMFYFAYNNKLLCVANKLYSYEYYKNDFMLNDNVTNVLFFRRGKFDNFVGARKKSSTSNAATKISNGNLKFKQYYNKCFYVLMIKNECDRKRYCDECQSHRLKKTY